MILRGARPTTSSSSLFLLLHFCLSTREAFTETQDKSHSFWRLASVSQAGGGAVQVRNQMRPHTGRVVNVSQKMTKQKKTKNKSGAEDAGHLQNETELWIRTDDIQQRMQNTRRRIQKSERIKAEAEASVIPSPVKVSLRNAGWLDVLSVVPTTPRSHASHTYPHPPNPTCGSTATRRDDWDMYRLFYDDDDGPHFLQTFPAKQHNAQQIGIQSLMTDSSGLQLSLPISFVMQGSTPLHCLVASCFQRTAHQTGGVLCSLSRALWTVAPSLQSVGQGGCHQTPLNERINIIITLIMRIFNKSCFSSLVCSSCNC